MKQIAIKKELEYRLEKINNCPICESNIFTELYRAYDRLGISEEKFILCKCSNCELVYQNPRVSPLDISLFYQNNYFKKRKLNNKKNIAKEEITLKYVKNKGKLIEIGSANGDFLYHMKKKGWYVEGVETSYEGVQNSKNKFNLDKIHHGNLANRNDNLTRFDAAVLWGVLPHIHNPVETISGISKILKDSGKLIITCANIESVPAKIMKDQWGHLDLPRHYFMYSPKSLNKLLIISGMEIEKIIFHDNLWNSNINLFKISPFCILNKNIFRIKFIYKIQIKILIKINELLTSPILLLSRLIKKGGIITVICKKRNNCS